MDSHVLPCSPNTAINTSTPSTGSPPSTRIVSDTMLVMSDVPPVTTVYVSEESQTHSSYSQTSTKMIYRKRQTTQVLAGQKAEAASSVCFPSSSSCFPPARDETPLPKAVQALRSRHGRAHSASSATSSRDKTSYPSPLRTRSSSTSTTELPFYKPHMFQTMPSSRPMMPRAQPILSLDRETEETIGSFSPTSCPRRQLHEILEASKPPSRLRFSSLRAFSTRPKLPWAIDTTAGSQTSAGACSRSPSSSYSDDEQSHLSSLPSICRTPSSYSESEYFPTAPSSVTSIEADDGAEANSRSFGGRVQVPSTDCVREL
ncbi:hypothetical protein BDY19DRAFT_995795 [Irpex rosettiformis]|uniref:Uncharacterized protein n=1 Tax=Irpex rosettiformis TaxID=378272 RepID=A0ACB8TWZ1_9APHY|nr:hypothetical protein BDY19DRAFT_995795 [Irpex rosettiformis]